MLSFEDKRWDGLKAGYRLPFDPRPLLRKLESGEDDATAWHELWDELHHQGDVGEGSYAAVPHLVRIYRQKGVLDWNIYAIVAIIELARGRSGNPDLPTWLETDYFGAIRELAQIGITEYSRANDPNEIRGILGILAVQKGARRHGKLLVEYSEEELLDLESQM